MSIAEESAVRSRTPVPDDWPDLFSSPAFVVPEAGRWTAVATKFSLVGVGDTPGEAWQQMDELGRDYFEACRDEGLSWSEVLRPMPIAARAKLWTWRVLLAVVFVPLAPLLLLPALRERARRHRRFERDFVAAQLNGQHAHC